MTMVEKIERLLDEEVEDINIEYLTVIDKDEYVEIHWYANGTTLIIIPFLSKYFREGALDPAEWFFRLEKNKQKFYDMDREQFELWRRLQ